MNNNIKDKVAFYVFSFLGLILFPLVFLGIYSITLYLGSKLDSLFDKYGINSTIKLIFFGGVKGIRRIFESSQ
ncbi:MAG: hypothetical protein GF329_13790 [Candidatus Lokiarchaeota archaeon]|nr:hypothetical protein [Candidatus Lokiarchaeota archaeon]